jgi:hypothetical protein
MSGDMGPDGGNMPGLEGLLDQVQALRSPPVAGGAPPLDPVRLHYIESLARRLQAAPSSVQKVLQAKLHAALRDLGAGTETATPAAHPDLVEAPSAAKHPEPVEAQVKGLVPRRTKPKARPEAALPAAPLSLLGQLNQHIQAVSAQSPGSSQTSSPPDLKSAVRFRETWARISAETEVDKATHRAPENAGPLNAHNLVLRTLALMRELSPDYLRRFMGHTESLLWLDQAYGQLKQPAAKTKAAKGSKPPKAKAP